MSYLFCICTLVVLGDAMDLYSSHTPRSSWAGVMGITIIQDNTYDSTLANLISNTTATTNTFPHTLARCLPGRTASSPGWVRF